MDTHNTKSTGTSASPKLEAIRYLSKKSGVLATIALDKETGAILQTSGELSSFRRTSATRAAATSALAQPGSNGEAETGGIEETAMMVWNFLKAAGGLVSGLDAEDEVKLLRLRTKKHELVIVPDAKYVMIVVHETPPA